MPRRRYPFAAFFVDPSLVDEGGKRDLAIRGRAIAIRDGILTIDAFIEDGLRDTDSSLYSVLTQPTATLVLYARRHIVRSRLRLVTFRPSRGPRDKKFRVFVSAMVNGQRQLVPPPWLVQQPALMREVLNRAVAFRNAWDQHRQNMLALQRLSQRVRYWRA